MESMKIDVIFNFLGGIYNFLTVFSASHKGP